MSIHRSKGLQFPIVIVGELGKRFNLKDAQGSILYDRERGIALEAVDSDRRIQYPTLPYRLVSQSVQSENLAEELRILYVALTRAEDKLILVGTGKPLEVSSAMLTHPGSIETGKHDRVAGPSRRRGHGEPENDPGATDKLSLPVPNPQSPTPNPKSNPLPLLDRRGASGMLDWITGAIVAQPPEHVAWTDNDDEALHTLFSIRNYTPGEMSDWSTTPASAPSAGDRLDRLARMAALDGPPLESPPIVQRVARRLTTPYKAKALSRIPAVAAASVLKRRWNAMEDEIDPAATWVATEGRASPPVIHQRSFESPDFMSATAAPAATRVGTWTHEFLQRVDLTRPCDRGDLKAQLTDHVSLGAVAESEAAAIDLDAVAWFFGTPLGAIIRAKSTRLLREWPFTLGVDPARYDPRAAEGGAIGEGDVMLVRGIIDLLFDSGEGWEVLDYKTDRVAGETLRTRAAEYKGQLQIYAAAVKAAWHRPPRRNWLVFLNARTLIEI
ncbi:MAG: PD-(D/E)XK nuclease family protein [Phycisphaerae bacterium]